MLGFGLSAIQPKHMKSSSNNARCYHQDHELPVCSVSRVLIFQYIMAINQIAVSEHGTVVI